MSRHPDDCWQTLGSVALRVARDVERQRRAEKLFGPVPTDDELRALYPPAKPDQGEAA